MTRWFRCGLSVSGPFVCRCLTSPSCSVSTPRSSNRTGAISRIRLSEKGSRGRPRKAAGPRGKADQTQHIMQGGFRKLPGRRPGHFVLGAQPLTQPFPGMPFHSPVGIADWTQTEVVGPPNHHAVELSYHCFCIQQGFISSGLVADRLHRCGSPASWTERCPDRPAPFSASNNVQTYTPENQTSLPADRLSIFLKAVSSFDVLSDAL